MKSLKSEFVLHRNCLPDGRLKILFDLFLCDFVVLFVVTMEYIKLLLCHRLMKNVF